MHPSSSGLRPTLPPYLVSVQTMCAWEPHNSVHCNSNVLVPRLCAKEVVQKKDPPSFVLVSCMHDTPMILWTQHAQSYHNNGTMLVGAHANHTLPCQIHPEN